MTEPQPQPPFSRRGTSEEAANSIDAATWRGKTVRRVHRHGIHGMTCFEGEDQFDLSHQNMSARLNELESTKDTKRIRGLRANGVPKQLFVIDDDDYDKRIVRTKLGSKTPSLVYFHIDFYEAVLEHYKVTKLGPKKWNGDLFDRDDEDELAP